jgi:hypothetical protein
VKRVLCSRISALLLFSTGEKLFVRPGSRTLLRATVNERARRFLVERLPLRDRRKASPRSQIFQELELDA